MNKTKIEWVKGPNGEPGYTWNPVTGCLHGCPYCYAKRIAERFTRGTGKDNMKIHDVKKPVYDEWIIKEGEYGHIKDPYPYGFEPTFHKYRLDEPRRKTKGAKIFVSSMGDLFGDWVPSAWICDVLNMVEECPQHTFMFLTKNPWNYEKFEYPKNAWCGTTITSSADSLRAYQLCRAKGATVKYLSIEPLLGEIKWNTGALPTELDWIIVGAQTGPGAKPPKPEWVQSIIDQARAAEVPIFLKDNLHWPEKIQKWPEGLK